MLKILNHIQSSLLVKNHTCFVCLNTLQSSTVTVHKMKAAAGYFCLANLRYNFEPRSFGWSSTSRSCLSISRSRCPSSRRHPSVEPGYCQTSFSMSHACHGIQITRDSKSNSIKIQIRYPISNSKFLLK